MENFYLVQVLGTFLEVSDFTIEGLKTKSAAMVRKNNLSGKTYRLFVGKRPIGSNVDFTFTTFAKEAMFA